MMLWPTRPFSIPEGAPILVRANNWVGDVVLSTPALSAIRAARPKDSIAVLAKPSVIPVLGHNPDIDRILLFDAKGRHKGLLGLQRLSRDLRGYGFSGCILLQRAFEAAWIAYLSRIPVRAGYTTDGRALLLTHRIKARREDLRVHRVEHNLRLLAALGIPSAGTDLRLPTGTDHLERAQRTLAARGVGPDDTLIGLSPGAAFGPAKRWPAERFATLADSIVATMGDRVLVLGSQQERALGEGISQMASGASILNLAGTTSLEEAAATIGLCGLFVTNDSGLMHVAAALDVPLVAIFGPTDPKATAPWSGRHKIVRKEDLCCSPCLNRECKEDHHRCMEAITPGDVLRALRDLVATHGLDTASERAKKLKVSRRAVPILRFG